MSRSDWIILAQFALNVLVITLSYWREWRRGYDGRMVVQMMRSLGADSQRRAQELATYDREAATGAICSAAAWGTAAEMVEEELLDGKASQ